MSIKHNSEQTMLFAFRQFKSASTCCFYWLIIISLRRCDFSVNILGFSVSALKTFSLFNLAFGSCVHYHECLPALCVHPGLPIRGTGKAFRGPVCLRDPGVHPQKGVHTINPKLKKKKLPKNFLHHITKRNKTTFFRAIPPPCETHSEECLQ